MDDGLTKHGGRRLKRDTLNHLSCSMQHQSLPASVCPDPSWPFRDRTEECDLFDAMPQRERARTGLPLEVGFFDYIGKAMWVTFAIVVLSGICLLFGYRPTVDESFRSVEHIQQYWSGGWWLRGLHKFGTDLFVILAIMRLCRIAYRRAYKFPGDFGWLTAVGMFLFGVVSAVTGYLLFWNQSSSIEGTLIDSQNHTSHGWHIGALIGNHGISQQVLNTILPIHIALSLIFLLVIVMWRTHPRWQVPAYKAFKPEISSNLIWTILGVLTLIALFAPPPIGSPLDKVLSPSPVYSHWFIIAWFRLIHEMDFRLSLGIFTLTLALVIFLPWLDPIRSKGPHPIITAAIFATLLTWLAFTVAAFAYWWPITNVVGFAGIVWILSIAYGIWNEKAGSQKAVIRK
jgi:quinol-cytochrome oxidoreductase complex cytochrome b subunit